MIRLPFAGNFSRLTKKIFKTFFPTLIQPRDRRSRLKIEVLGKFVEVKSGSGGKIRTYNLSVNSRLLYH